MNEEEFQGRLSSLPGQPFREDYEEAVFDLMKVATREQRAVLLELLHNRPASSRLTPEERISRALRPVLERIVDGAESLETQELCRACVGLEHLLSSILAEAYPYWKKESLDGFNFSEARRLGPEEAELFGVCILISDQTVTPIHVHLRVAPSEDKIDWLECRLGKRGPDEGDMERVPWKQWHNNPFVGLPNSKELVDWVYMVTFGA